MKVFWEFKIRIESKTEVYTQKMIEELERLLASSEKISDFEIQGL